MRSRWKHFFFLKKNLKIKNKNDQKLFKIPRSIIINNLMIDRSFIVHNGKTWVPFLIKNSNFCNHKLGEFVFTKKIPQPLASKKKKEQASSKSVISKKK